MLERVVRFGLALFVSVIALCGGSKATEAAEYYDVIYGAAYGGTHNPETADWIANAILYSSSQYAVDPLLITSVMKNESGFDFNATSSAGAIGLMQLMPSTAASVGVDPYDPLQNVIGGTSYLRTCLDNFSGWGEYGITYSVAAYNAGCGAVHRYGGVPPYAETINYVNNIAATYNDLLYQVTYY